MTPEEIKDGNKLIAEFLGYKYYHPGIDIEWDCGYERKEVFSKVPIETNEYPDSDQYYFKDNFNWENYITDLEYHKNWNSLMPVVFKITRETGYMIYFWSNVCHIQHKDLFTAKYNLDNVPDDKNYMREFYSDTPENIIEAVYESVVAFIKWRNGKRKS